VVVGVKEQKMSKDKVAKTKIEHDECHKIVENGLRAVAALNDARQKEAETLALMLAGEGSTADYLDARKVSGACLAVVAGWIRQANYRAACAHRFCGECRGRENLEVSQLAFSADVAAETFAHKAMAAITQDHEIVTPHERLRRQLIADGFKRREAEADAAT
jgi:hypothetical protein